MTPSYEGEIKGLFALITDKTCSDGKVKSTIDDVLSALGVDMNVVLQKLRWLLDDGDEV